MRKYNLSKIMKKAWEIARKLKNSFAQALRMSWQIAKMELSLREDYDRFDEDDKITFNIWEGYGKVRAYYRCSWRSSYANSQKTNFIELI